MTQPYVVIMTFISLFLDIVSIMVYLYEPKYKYRGYSISRFLYFTTILLAFAVTGAWVITVSEIARFA